ncbi:MULTISPECIES: TrkH family potassium uptake protein [unclassified Helicobacter]|uniref:TrkH family potassium uptake protein n=1 Tax=unclassified Helicobacter TaxID=2593540 RepID=UPI0013157951|nr:MULTISPECIES: potassium transporter TrkG [unclassified Helicobacter]
MDKQSAKFLLFAYIIIIFLGTLILLLPQMHSKDLNFIDALFMVTSAISSTGLVVKSVFSDFTFLGQIFLLFLIQVGGLGYMIIASFIYIFFKNSFVKNKILKSNIDLTFKDDLSLVLKNMIILVLLIEFFGALILFLFFYPMMGFLNALWAGIFHSISAFNNAGFSVFQGGMLPYVHHYGVNLTISILVILGGLGYFVLLEIFHLIKRKNLSIHTKIVIIGTISLILISWIFFFLLEYHNQDSLESFDFQEKLLASFFTIINYRTSGFNTLDLSMIRDTSLFFASLFMIIGGSPAGTAGGIKITTIVVVILYIYWSIKGEERVIVFRREIEKEIVYQAYLIIMLTFFVLIISLMVLSFLEDGNQRGFLALLFEVCSAFSTTGLSVGNGDDLSLSALFGDSGKMLIIFLMIMGKIGALAFLIGFFRQQKQSRISYVQTKILL